MKPAVITLVFAMLLLTGCQSNQSVAPAMYQTRASVTPHERPDEYLVAMDIERISESGEVLNVLARPKMLVKAGSPAECKIGEVSGENSGDEHFKGIAINVLIDQTDMQLSANVGTTISDGKQIVWSSQSRCTITQ